VSGTWAKGVSGNPGGRPKGCMQFAKEVGEATKGGLLMLKTCMRIALGQDPGATPADKLNACLPMRLRSASWLHFDPLASAIF